MKEGKHTPRFPSVAVLRETPPLDEPLLLTVDTAVLQHALHFPFIGVSGHLHQNGTERGLIELVASS